MESSCILTNDTNPLAIQKRASDSAGIVFSNFEKQDNMLCCALIVAGVMIQTYKILTMRQVIQQRVFLKTNRGFFQFSI